MNVLHTREGGVELRFSVAKVFNNTKKTGCINIDGRAWFSVAKVLNNTNKKKGCINIDGLGHV